MKPPSLVLLVIAFAVGVTSWVIGGTGNASEPVPTASQIRLAYEAADFRLAGAYSSGGEYAIAATVDGIGSELVSMADGTTAPSDVVRAVPTANGAFVFGNPDDQTIERLDVASGVTTTRTIPFEDAAAAWSIVASVAAGDGGGRFALFRGSSASFGRTAVFLYDFETDALVRSNGDAISGDVTNAVPETISLDGTVVVYREFRDASWTTVRWARSTDVRTAYGPDGDVVTRGGDVSPDFEWELFVSADAEIPSEIDLGRRYYRRNLISGWVGIVDVDPDDVRRADIYAGGRVVMRIDTPTPRDGDPNATAAQLFVSDVGQPARLLSVLPDRSPAPLGVEVLIAANQDATAISFTAFGPELTTGTGDDARRWYVAEIPPSTTRIDGPATATVLAVRCTSSEIC